MKGIPNYSGNLFRVFRTKYVKANREVEKIIISENRFRKK